MDKLIAVIIPGEVCGGCDVSLVNLHEDLVGVLDFVDIAYWPIAMDVKEEDLEDLDRIDVAIFQGSVRTEKQRELIEYVAEKAKIKVAYGSCACFGGVPSLADLYEVMDLLRTAYRYAPSNREDNAIPAISEGSLGLPKLEKFNYRVDEVVDIDLFVPGCPPPKDIIAKLFGVLREHWETGKPITRGYVFASTKSLCDSCSREKPDVISIEDFVRPSQRVIDPKKCFLAQGIICLGPISRGGCGAPCVNSNVPCRGCMGPPEGVLDPGAKMVSALASLVKIMDEYSLSDEELVEHVQKIEDPVGLFYRFTMGLNRLVRLRRAEK